MLNREPSTQVVGQRRTPASCLDGEPPIYVLPQHSLMERWRTEQTSPPSMSGVGDFSTTNRCSSSPPASSTGNDSYIVDDDGDEPRCRSRVSRRCCDVRHFPPQSASAVSLGNSATQLHRNTFRCLDRCGDVIRRLVSVPSSSSSSSVFARLLYVVAVTVIVASWSSPGVVTMAAPTSGKAGAAQVFDGDPAAEKNVDVPASV